MSRQLTLKDKRDVYQLFGDRKSDYYFLLDEVEDNNFSSKNLKLYGEFSEGELKSIILNNGSNITYYSSENRELEPYHTILSKLEFSKVSCEERFANKFEKILKIKYNTTAYVGVVKELSVDRQYPNFELIKVTNTNELMDLHQLLSSIEEYKTVIPADINEYIELMIDSINKETDLVLNLYKNNQLLSTASAKNIRANSAVIVGVATNIQYRGKGYGTEVLIGLFRRLLNQGKYPYLFYTNPKARKVYKNLGMYEISKWRVMILGG